MAKGDWNDRIIDGVAIGIEPKEGIFFKARGKNLLVMRVKDKGF